MISSLGALFMLFLGSQLCPFVNADAQELSIPSAPSSKNVVDGNFLGISFELSSMNEYFGNDTDTIPLPMLNYLGEIRSRTGSNAVRIRVGGNSADVSTYVSSQTSPMLVLTDPNANSNNQPVDYGPMLWEVMNKVSEDVNSVQYLIGLTLNTTNTNSVIAGDAAKILESHLDAMLLGNEPDLYTVHGQRPAVQNYTVDDYISEFGAAVGDISNTTAGNLANGHNVAGPTVCCSWDLATLLQQGYLSNFTNVLKYITLQHYPQNNCFSSGYQYPLAYYTQHGNVVDLAAWQKPGIDIVTSNTTTGAPRMLMSEFNSASCGGIPGISDTFAVGSLWSVDYALQMASIGYVAAYIHTREQGISYNLVTPPNVSQVDSNTWTTLPPFYALTAAAEIFTSSNGSIVTDLNVSSNANTTVGGYAVYDTAGSSLNRIALFNYGNDSVEFALPSGLKAANTKNALVKFLSAESITEKFNIAWGEQTFLGAGDGKPVPANTSSGWAHANQNMDCSNGCNLTVPGPSLAVLFLDSASAGTQTNSAERDQFRGTILGLLSILVGIFAGLFI
ncbi:glycoside hydrolase family 79 protein [Collybiopsis luxurians FD-317 M1]|nr:glycoside hydrolase family 79 protein [Collybiopsis luxurians FD-317 M1]